MEPLKTRRLKINSSKNLACLKNGVRILLLKQVNNFATLAQYGISIFVCVFGGAQVGRPNARLNERGVLRDCVAKFI